jgi:hypothetical protein
LANLDDKAKRADQMFDSLMAHMTDALAIERDHYEGRATKQPEAPVWL